MFARLSAMSEDRDRLDQRLVDRLRAHEARVPGADPPQPAQRARGSWSYVAMASAFAVIALVVAIVLPQALKPTAVEPSSSPSATAGPESPLTSASEMPTESPAPTIPPRTAWAFHRVIEGNDPYTSMGGIVEIRGHLYALGVAGFEQPGIWVSNDGVRWHPTDIPLMQDGLVASVKDIIDLGDHLVALATGGYAEGSGPFVTMIYTSTDGESWQPVESTPGIDVGAHGALLQVGERLVAMGRDVWVSNDRGRSWSVSAKHDDLDGDIVSAAVRDGLIVAVGAKVASDLVEPPGLVWTSADGGDTWTRTELSSDSIPSTVTFGTDGQIIALTTSSAELVVWTSNDRAQTWNRKTMPTNGAVYDVTAVPGGYAATGISLSGDVGVVWTSADARSWTEQSIPIVGIDIDWTPGYGVVVSGHTMSIGLAPQPFTLAGPSLSRAASFGTDGRLETISDLTAWSGGFVAVGTRYEADRMPPFGPPPPHEGRVWTSADGRSWEDITPRDVFVGKELRFVAAAPDGSLIALGQHGDSDRLTNLVWRSTDGRSWQPIELADLPAHQFVKAFDAGPRGMVTALEDASLWYSNDGLRWRMTRSGPGYYDYPPSVLDVGAGPEGFVAILTDHVLTGDWVSYVVASSDGVSWVDGQTPSDAYRVSPLGPDWVIVSEPPANEGQTYMERVFLSGDGLSWEAGARFHLNTFDDPASNTRCVEYGARLFAAVERMFMSSDLTGPCSEGAFVTPGTIWSAATTSLDRWRQIDLPDQSSLRAIAERDGLIVLAANVRTESTRAEFWVIGP
jgi:hypothetical protein